jgi:uncharacterized protein (DUF4213/DUF364 family)
MEKNPLAENEGVLPDTACEEVVPKADIVVITRNAFANGTINRLLQPSGNARVVEVVGPTLSMVLDSPQAEVTAIGGHRGY